MSEPLILLAGLLTTVGGTLVSGIAGNEAHRFYLQWLESADDPRTGLPRNPDLNRASRESLRGALMVLLMEQAARLDPKKPWLPAIRQHIKDGKFGSVPLIEARTDPEWTWLEAARTKVQSEAFNEFHDRLRLSDDQVRECFREGETCNALARILPGKLIAWLEREASDDAMPDGVASLIRDGWEIHPGQTRRFTLAHVYCLFFREHLKADPKIFNIFTADTLNALRTRVEQQGNQLTSGLDALQEAVKKLAAQPPVFSQFEGWLTPQLGQLEQLLVDLEAQLAALARDQGHLRKRQGEVLVALTVLHSEVARGHADAKVALDQLSADLTGLGNKLDYLIGGLPILRFQQPDPPTHELQLLHAKHRTVPLLGRDADLGALCAWVESDETISARLLVGGAGTGKTRLGFELLLRVAEALPGWQSGLLGGADLRRLVEKTHTGDFNWLAPTLLVVDYAQTLASPLTELFRALTYNRHGQPPLRLLLLERQAGDWFDDLLRLDDGAMPCPVRGLFHPAQPLPLTPLPPGQFRRRILAETVTRVGDLTGKPPVALPPPADAAFEDSLAHPRFDQPLHLMLAALVAGDLGLATALRRERVDLAEDLAKRELRRVARYARIPGNAAQERALQHLTACATLERGFTPEELDRAVAEELTELRITWPDGPGDLAMLLRQALPGDRLPVAPVEPDFVGEALVLLALARPDGTGPDRWQRWCATIKRCCRRDSRTTPATLLHAFQNLGHNPDKPDHGEALLAATDTLIRAGVAEAEPSLLMGIEAALPQETVALRERAAEVTQHLYQRLADQVRDGKEKLEPEVARLANNLAIRLSASGRQYDALAPAQHAVDLCRALDRRQPGAFTPALAMSVNNLSTILSALGRRADALAPAYEAVDLFRALDRQQPDGFTAGLASSLDNLATSLCELGRRAGALGAAQEAVDLHRALARRHPNSFTPNLASSLNNMAIQLGELGRRDDALCPAQEAVDLYRALARRLPDSFNPGLAMSLNTLAGRLSELGRRDDALSPAQEAVGLYRALDRRQPGAFTPDLAASLNNLATFLSRLGRRDDALSPAQEAVGLYRALDRRQPGAFTPDLAMSLNNLAIRLSELGRQADALAPAHEAVALYRTLDRRQPDSFTPDLAMSLNNLAIWLGELGHRTDALASAQEAVELYRALIQQQPDAVTPGLACSLDIMGRLQEANGAAEAALACFREGVERLTPAFQQFPAAFAGLMRQLTAEYFRVLNASGREPYITGAEAFLAPVAEGLQRLADASPGGDESAQ